MKLGLNRIETVNDKPPFRISVKNEFETENTEKSKYQFEVEKDYNSVKAIIVCDIINGILGSKPHLYTWLNRPHKEGKNKINYRRL